MPMRILCGRCGYVFYEGDELIPPETVAKKYGFRCPRCSSPLQVKPLKIRIEPRGGRGRRRRI